MPNRVWASESQPEEKGSFCDSQSRIHYTHGNLTDAVQQESEAIERGEEFVWLDAPYLPADTYTVQPGQEFNLYCSEDDGQGGLTPRKEGPGR